MYYCRDAFPADLLLLTDRSTPLYFHFMISVLWARKLVRMLMLILLRWLMFFLCARNRGAQCVKLVDA